MRHLDGNDDGVGYGVRGTGNGRLEITVIRALLVHHHFGFRACQRRSF